MQTLLKEHTTIAASIVSIVVGIVGIVAGIGYALMEEMRVEDGRVTNLSLGDYKLPTSRDLPPLTTILLETEHGVGTVHDRDLDRLLQYFTDAAGAPLAEDVLDESMSRLQQGNEAQLWLKFRGASIGVGSIRSATVEKRFSFRTRPEAPAGEEVCR